MKTLFISLTCLLLYAACSGQSGQQKEPPSTIESLLQLKSSDNELLNQAGTSVRKFVEGGKTKPEETLRYLYGKDIKVSEPLLTYEINGFTCSAYASPGLHTQGWLRITISDIRLISKDEAVASVMVV